MFLVSGDDDLTEAVEEVQGHGIPVILLVAPDRDGKAHAVSKHLRREADDVVMISPDTIDLFVQARTRPEPEPEVSVEETVEPARPTPALLAGRKPAAPGVVPPSPEVVRSSALVYSSASGQVAAPVEETPQVLIDEVCTSVLTTWLQRARADEVEQLRSNDRQIPGDIDRALLTDLSARTGHYYIEERDRHLLRDRFWVIVAELPS
jgi:hypothetical protein